MKKGDTDKVEVNKKKVILNLNWKYQDEPKIFFFLAKKSLERAELVHWASLTFVLCSLNIMSLLGEVAEGRTLDTEASTDALKYPPGLKLFLSACTV